ncbi:MAG: RlpA-like double-psi beta-barrel-protein domain-containing protein-containing protein [Monoraphidium minutum]|nr:MAG: RlpA-like double-psi beta-barrel-protein domain-containing protein-containing protein [Monoraphidium minutum]
MARLPLLLALLGAALLLQGGAAAAAAEAWIEGRATFYDDNQQGSCKYYEKVPQFYGAWPDTLDAFAGSCGKCVEVACVNAVFSDNYGGQLERKGACYNESRTVVLQVTDSCPCVHANAYSNKRWCCGDMKHLDLGRAVFRELAQERWGVVGARWRVVDCSRLGQISSIPELSAPGGANDTPQRQQHPKHTSQAPEPAVWRAPQPASNAEFPPAWGHFSLVGGADLPQIANGAGGMPQIVGTLGGAPQIIAGGEGQAPRISGSFQGLQANLGVPRPTGWLGGF